jgi:hypothetical protein
LAELEENIDDLDQLAKNQDGDAIRQTLSQILPDYHPQEVEVEEEF